MYHLQGTSKLQFLFRHYRNDDTSGHLMKISMRYTQLETGLSKPYYTYNYYKAHCLATPTWHTNIWQYCSESHVRLREEDPWVYDHPREHDFHLMGIVLRSDITQEQKEVFNRVRLNSRLLTASDIVMVNSPHKISTHILKSVNTRESTLNWPKVMNLPKNWSDTFRMVIKQVVIPQLQSTPLGKWMEAGHQRFHYYNETTRKVISFIQYMELTEADRIEFTPVEYCVEKKKVLGYQKIHEKVVEEQKAKLENIITMSPRWMRNLWRGNDIKVNNLQQMLEKLNKDDVSVAGDGSVRDQLGSFAWCMASKTSERPFFTATGPVDGHRHHMKALRAEATHILASVALLCQLEQFSSITSATIPIYTDCQTLINRVKTNTINSPSLVLADHIDLVYQIRELIKNSRFKFELQYAKTIKDDDFDLASRDERLVQMMHVKAYGCFKGKTVLVPRQYSDVLPGAKILIVANNRPVVSDVGMSMQTSERLAVRNDYFESRMQIEKSMLENVDTYTLGRVISKMPSRQAMYSKIKNGQAQKTNVQYV